MNKTCLWIPRLISKNYTNSTNFIGQLLHWVVINPLSKVIYFLNIWGHMFFICQLIALEKYKWESSVKRLSQRLHDKLLNQVCMYINCIIFPCIYVMYRYITADMKLTTFGKYIQINPLSSNSDKHLISPYNIPTWSNIQVTRIKEMITKHEMSWCLCKFS